MVAPTGTLVLGFGQDAADAVAPVPTAAETARAATTATRSTREIGDMLITPWVLPVREMVLLSAESAFSVSGRRVRRVNVTGRRGGPVARMVAGGKEFSENGTGAGQHARRDRPRGVHAVHQRRRPAHVRAQIRVVRRVVLGQQVHRTRALRSH